MSNARVDTGIAGLDEVLAGGFLRGRTYMVTGKPGTGKTILGMQYLESGAENGETCLYVHLEESEAAIRSNADTIDVDLDGVEFLDLRPDADVFVGDGYDVFAPGETDGAEVRGTLAARIDDVAPDRVFIDPLTQLRRLAASEQSFRTQVLGLMQLLAKQDATVVFTSQSTPTDPDDDLQFLADGTVELDRPSAGRTVEVTKFRGSDTRSGVHSLRITDHGLHVYPVLAPGTHQQPYTPDQLSSGVPEVDELLHGGLERGSVTILSGPTGVGKTTLGTQFMKEAAGRGERSVIYMFEENVDTLLDRCENVNIPATAMVERGTLGIEPVEALERSPAEFASIVREEVEERDARIVMIDGIDGYRLSIQGEEQDLERELNSLCRYLKNMGVAVVLVDSVDAITGSFQPTNGGVSYLADNIVFLRYLEIQGELRKAIGILKKRSSDFERALREFEITPHGIKVGDPLTELRGILSGTPEFVGRDTDDATRSQ